MTEVRLTDPKTGGQKGVKRERYDLIPHIQLEQIGVFYKKLGEYEPLQLLVDSVGYFWLGSRARSLAYAAAIAAQHVYRDLNANVNAQDGALYTIHDVPFDVVEDLAECYGFGATKYDDDNWKKGYKWSLSYGAMMRHLKAYLDGEHVNAESGNHHLTHFIWHCVTIMWWEENNAGEDNRQKEAA